MHLPSLFSHLGTPEFVILIPVIVLIMGGAIALSGIRFAQRREQLWHETARLALEKGQPIPQSTWDGPNPERVADFERRAESMRRCRRFRRGRGDFRGGLVLLALGAGLFIALSNIPDGHPYFAAIPGCIGVALLINGIIEQRLSNRDSLETIPTKQP